MAEVKTKKTEASVEDFLSAVKDDEKQKDARKLSRLMQRVTGEKPKMWGTSIVGFGEFRYRYGSGREGDWLVTGFSPRAQNLTIYLMAGFANLKDELKKLGKHSTGSSCLYVKRLADIDVDVLASIVARGAVETRALGTASKDAGKAKRALTKSSSAVQKRTPTTKKASPKKKAPSKKRL